MSVLLGSLGLLCIDIPWCVWCGVVMYGIGNGPCVGYCYDLGNRITVASEQGMAIVMLGNSLPSVVQ